VASCRPRFKPGTRQVVGWVVDYKDPKKTKRTKGGFRTKAAAEDWITDLRSSLKDGTFIPPQTLSTRMEDVAEEWFANLRTRRRLKAVTIEGYELIFNAHILPKFGRKKVGEITTGQIEDWLATLKTRSGKPASPQTVRNVNFALKACFNWAVRMEKLKVNPCNHVELPKAHAATRKALTEAQVMAVAGQMSEPSYSLLTRFAAYTGLRKGELLALRVMNLNTLHKLVEVNASMSGAEVSTTKTAAGVRTVPVPSALWDELTTYLGARINEPGSRVFLDPNPTNPRFVWRRFYQAYQPAVKAIFPLDKGEVVFHSLRHTYTSLLEELEVRPKIMAMVLGHSTGKVTFDTYTHVGPAQLAAVGERVNERYLAALNPTLTNHNDTRLTAVPSPAPHTCPHCSGTGFIQESASG